METTAIIGGIISIIGAVFLLLASLGIIRMPDVYNRMQAGTKATTMGSIFFLLGIAIASPSWTGKVLILILFIVFTNPISSHVLARAAHYRGIRLSEDFSVRDCLSDDEAGEEGVCE